MPIQIPAVSSTLVFFGRSNTTQTLGAAGTAVALNLQAHDIDELNGHSTTTNISRYTCQRAGLYSVSGSAFLSSNSTAVTSANSYRIATINKNGANIPGATTWGVYSLASTGMHVTILPVPVILAVNDYIQVTMTPGLASIVMGGDATNGSTLRVDFIR